MIHAGRKPGYVNRDKIVAGSLITTAWAATFLLEKPRGHKIFDETDKNPNPGLLDKITGNPRAWIAAPLAMGNNLFNLKGANNERIRFRNEALAARRTGNHAEIAYTEAKQHDYIWNVVTACSFLVAHTLFGVSGSKRPVETEDDKCVMNDLTLLAANVLMKQPEAIRGASIEETADYVSKLAHVNANKDEVAKAIQEKITALSQSTWVARTQKKPAAVHYSAAI